MSTVGNIRPNWLYLDAIYYVNQTPNFRSDVLNTDNRGFRFNSINLTQIIQFLSK